VAKDVALGATVLNRFAITIVEAVLLLLGALLWRAARRAHPSDDGRVVPEVGV
jgi:hypothetical protein